MTWSNYCRSTNVRTNLNITILSSIISLAYNLTILIMPWSDHHSLDFVSGLLLMTKVSQFKIIQYIIVNRRLSYQGIFHRACSSTEPTSSTPTASPSSVSSETPSASSPTTASSDSQPDQGRNVLFVFHLF